MITTEFIQGKRAAYYEVKVSINRDNTTLESYSFGLCTKANYDAVLSALRASLKDSYKLEVWIGRGLLHDSLPLFRWGISMGPSQTQVCRILYKDCRKGSIC